ncbi:MAG: hypothetical protein ABI183_04065 [Polyangiaceae bacterium]
MLIRKIEITDVAGVVLTRRQVDARARCLEDGLAHRHDLLTGLERVERRCDIERHAYDGITDAKLGALERSTRNLLARGDRKKAQKVLRNRQISAGRNISCDRKFETATNHRILHQARLNEIGLCEGEIFVGGLQRFVVEQRHENGVIQGKWARENAVKLLRDRSIIVATIVPMNALSCAIANQLCGVAKIRIRRRGRAANHESQT